MAEDEVWATYQIIKRGKNIAYTFYPLPEGLSSYVTGSAQRRMELRVIKIASSPPLPQRSFSSFLLLKKGMGIQPHRRNVTDGENRDFLFSIKMQRKGQFISKGHPKIFFSLEK